MWGVSTSVHLYTWVAGPAAPFFVVKAEESRWCHGTESSILTMVGDAVAEALRCIGTWTRTWRRGRCS